MLLGSAVSSAFAEEETTVSLRILLKGEGELEVAPHGDGNVYAAEVHHHAGLYRMWYGGQGADGHDRILYAVSDDGEAWTRKGVVIDNGDANHVNDPTVAIVNGQFYLYYTRATRNVIDRICLATSRDGEHWKDHGIVINAGPEGEWDALSVGRPSVLYHEGRFHLWYDGRKDFPAGAPVKDVPLSSDSRRAIGYATSRDGVQWEKHSANPVFGNNAGGIDVALFEDRFLLFYESGRGTCLAESPDGIQWQDHGLFLPKTGEAEDQFGHVTPQLVDDDRAGRINLYVGAAPDRSWNKNQIGVFTLEGKFLRQRLSR